MMMMSSCVPQGQRRQWGACPVAGGPGSRELQLRRPSRLLLLLLLLHGPGSYGLSPD